MKRLLWLTAVAVVAAAMYVAASSASQQSRGPTAKQFNALKKQVATLGKTLKGVRAEADAAVGIIGTCYLSVSGSTATINTMPVSQLGSASSGFLYGTSGTAAPRTALDITASNPQAYLQEVTPACVTGSAGFLQRWARHSH